MKLLISTFVLHCYIIRVVTSVRSEVRGVTLTALGDSRIVGNYMSKDYTRIYEVSATNDYPIQV